jgi:hypothetical protein
MRVAVDPSIEVSPKTVGELRKVKAWPENLVITTPEERSPESVVKVSKASLATRVSPKHHSGAEAEWPLRRTAGVIRFRSLGFDLGRNGPVICIC